MASGTTPTPTPAPTPPPSSGASTSPDHVQATEAIKATRIARWAIGISVVSALLSIGVSTVGVVDQVRVSDEARAERLTEHAVRVAWWRGDGVNGGTFVIQNRSLVPLDSVVLRYSAAYADGREPSSELVPIDEGPIFAFWSIAPCTIVALNEAAIEAHYLPRSPETGNTTNITGVY